MYGYLPRSNVCPVEPNILWPSTGYVKAHMHLGEMKWSLYLERNRGRFSLMLSTSWMVPKCILKITLNSLMLNLTTRYTKIMGLTLDT
jgi:hypothetical protein